jgi:hypothetical protein
VAATRGTTALVSHDLEGLIGLVRDADGVELKLTVPDEDRLSTKRAPRDLLDTATQTGTQATKTRKALSYFSGLAV